ncbi:hypothetical protein YC2023_088682 [Brassica napus]
MFYGFGGKTSFEGGVGRSARKSTDNNNNRGNGFLRHLGRTFQKTEKGPGKLHGIYPTLLPGRIAPSLTKGASVTNVGAISSLGGMKSVSGPGHGSNSVSGGAPLIYTSTR